MGKLPFSKAILYLAVVKCKINFEQPSLVEFIDALNEYFPFVCFDSPFTHVQNILNSIHSLPTSIIKGNYNKLSLQKFLKEADLFSLHEIFERTQFQDLIYNVDLRTKVDGMAIAGFRPHEIELEIKQYIQDVDPVIVKVYLDCFANYRGMAFDEKRNFINRSFEEPLEKKRLLQCVENKSQDKIRMLLGVSTKTYNPIELINRTAQIVTFKTNEGLIDDDDSKLQSYLKLGIKVAEVLNGFGVGNKDAAEMLLAALTKKPEDVGIVTPKPMTVEELEDVFLNQTRAPAS